MRKTKILIASLSLLFLLGACARKTVNEDHEIQSEGALAQSSETHPIVTIVMENGDEILIELYPEVAPNSVNNFISLINSGYYDGLSFHRVIPGFMIQGGDPEGTGAGGPGYSIKGEFSSNGFENKLLHTRGVISMARAQAPNSAGSQFFIMHADAPSLDGEYASFGQVIEGMDAVDKIVNVETGKNDRPVDEEKQIMKKVSVDLKGETYDSPIKAE